MKNKDYNDYTFDDVVINDDDTANTIHNSQNSHPNKPPVSFPSPTDSYDEMFILIEPDVYIVYWSITKKEITFEVHVKTSGWFTLGLNNNGFIHHSDLVVGWLNSDGTGNFSGIYFDMIKTYQIFRVKLL